MGGWLNGDISDTHTGTAVTTDPDKEGRKATGGAPGRDISVRWGPRGPSPLVGVSYNGSGRE